MRTATLFALASVVIVVGPAFAAGGAGGSGGGGMGHGGFGRGGPGHGGHFHGRHDTLRSSIPTRLFPRHHHRGFAGQPFFHGQRFFNGQQFFPFGGGYGVVAPPAYGYGYGYGYPAYAYSAPRYILSESVPPPPMYYSSSSSYATPPMQGVIEFSSGRYVLQGEGSVYRWVWVPNPPPAPPTAAPAPLSASAAPEPVRSLEFYRWTDSEGVTHLSDRLEQVPPEYRSKVTKSRT